MAEKKYLRKGKVKRQKGKRMEFRRKVGKIIFGG